MASGGENHPKPTHLWTCTRFGRLPLARWDSLCSYYLKHLLKKAIGIPALGSGVERSAESALQGGRGPLPPVASPWRATIGTSSPNPATPRSVAKAPFNHASAPPHICVRATAQILGPSWSGSHAEHLHRTGPNVSGA